MEITIRNSPYRREDSMEDRWGRGAPPGGRSRPHVLFASRRLGPTTELGAVGLFSALLGKRL